VTSVAAHASNTPPRSITSGAIAPCRALRFDESGDGLIQFNELNTQLRQSVAVDAAVLGNNVRGEAAARSEREANLRRTNTMKKGVANVAAAQRVKGAGRGGSKGGSKGSGGGVPGVPGGLDVGTAAACAAQALTQLRALFANDPSGMMELFREIDTSGDGLVRLA
jgi:hypothetical protein